MTRVNFSRRENAQEDASHFINNLLKDITWVTRVSGLRLRPYQVDVAKAIAEFVIKRLGLSIVVIFPRQSGKNELQAQIETYLMVIFSTLNAEMVKVSPTWKPQSLNAMRRLERVLSRNLITIRQLEERIRLHLPLQHRPHVLLFRQPRSQHRGRHRFNLARSRRSPGRDHHQVRQRHRTDGGQHQRNPRILGHRLDQPHALARELRAARKAQQKDGVRRVFVLDAEDVAEHVPDYGIFVKAQVDRLGRMHPMIRTQYYSEEIDAEGSFFTPRRLALMQGTQQRSRTPQPGKLYALLLDVAGEDESDTSTVVKLLAGPTNPARDSTALTIIEIDLSTLADPIVRAPTYRVVDRHAWLGVKHSTIYPQITRPGRPMEPALYRGRRNRNRRRPGILPGERIPDAGYSIYLQQQNQIRLRLVAL